MKVKGIVLGLAKYAVGFGLLAYVISANWGSQDFPASGDHPARHIAGLNELFNQPPIWWMIPAAAALMLAVILLQFYRWYLLVRAVDLPFTVRNALRLGFVGYFYNIFLPGAIGGDLVKAWFIARDHPTRKPVAVATVLIDRLLGLFGLVLLASLVGGYCWLNGDARIIGNEYLKTIIRGTSLTVLVIVTAWLVLGWIPERLKNRIEDFLHKLKPRKLGQTFAELWFAIRTYRVRSKVIYQSVGLSAGAHICMVLLFHVCVRIFPVPGGDPATLPEHAVVAPIGYIGQVFFPVPGGVGGAEAIFGLLYEKALGRPESTGIIGRLSLRVFEWSIGLLGYLMYLNMRKELTVEEPQSSSANELN